MDLKRNLKSKLYSDWKDKEALKPKLLLLFSGCREKLLFDTLGVTHICMHWGVEN